MKKAKTAADAKILEQIPNVGPRIAADFRLLGIREPAGLQGLDPLKLYKKLNHKTGQIHDPCVLDTFMAAISFMNGEGAKPWWEFTPLRKKTGGSL